MKTLQVGLLSIAFGTMIACGGSPTTADGSDDDSSDGNGKGTASSADVAVPASSATKDAAGVDHWSVSSKGVTGYDSASRPTVTFQYQDTTVSSDTTKSAVVLKVGDSVTHWEYTVQTREDGMYRVTDYKTDDSANAALATLELLGTDLSASTPPAGSSLSTSSLRPLNNLTGGGVKLTAGCWNEEVIHANGHVYVITTTHGANGTWNESVECVL